MKDEDYWTQVVTHLLMKAYGKSTVIWIHIITGAAVLTKYRWTDITNVFTARVHGHFL